MCEQFFNYILLYNWDKTRESVYNLSRAMRHPIAPKSSNADILWPFAVMAISDGGGFRKDLVKIQNKYIWEIWVSAKINSEAKSCQLT